MGVVLQGMQVVLEVGIYLPASDGGSSWSRRPVLQPHLVGRDPSGHVIAGGQPVLIRPRRDARARPAAASLDQADQSEPSQFLDRVTGRPLILDPSRPHDAAKSGAHVLAVLAD